MKLVIAEKNSAAERIASILSGDGYSEKKIEGISVYEWDNMACIGLAGHVMDIDFEEGYGDWNSVDPSDLIDAEIVEKIGKKDIVDAVKKVAEDADEVIIATDYDTEGELIGKEACTVSGESVDNVDRAKFSSLTPQEIEIAFSNPEDLDINLASAGEARREIDLLWGASLTRYLSLASGRLGDSFISVGRVQSPTLKILVDREKEREEFDPESYWEIYADLKKQDQGFGSKYFYKDNNRRKKKIWNKEKAQDVFKKVDVDTAIVENIESKIKTDNPPIPFNTTQFIRAAGSIGFSASGSMSVAEDLYTEGFISYPRTDNTVYSDEIDLRSILKKLSEEFEGETSELLKGDLNPTSGDKETTDHPPIHPTAIASKEELSNREWKIYELIVRRFFATLSSPAKWKKDKVILNIKDEKFESRGKELIEPGYHSYYPYFNKNENKIPDLESKEKIEVVDTRIEEGETSPPSRIGQSKLVEKMEDLGLGTKCLAEDTSIIKYNKDTENIDIVTAKDLFEKNSIVLADGDSIEASIGVKSHVFSLNEATGQIATKPISMVTRRKLKENEEMLKISNKNGCFYVTDQHPVYIKNKSDIEIKPAENVKPGDKLLTTRTIKNRQETNEKIKYNEIKDSIDEKQIKREYRNILPIKWDEKLIDLIVDYIKIHSSKDKHSRKEEFISNLSNIFKNRYDVTFDESFNIDYFVCNILEYILDDFTRIPEDLYPSFIGELFEDIGYIEKEKIHFSDIDIKYLTKIKEIFETLGINISLNRSKGILTVQGRHNIERFLDQIPINSDEDFYTLFIYLKNNEKTRKKAYILEKIWHNKELSEKEIKELLNTRYSEQIVEELKGEGYIKKNYGNLYCLSRSFEKSIYSCLCQIPSSLQVEKIETIQYDGYVYDLTIDNTSPNFSVSNGVLVHNSTRHETIRKLYNRGYIEGKPPRPTALARSVVRAMENTAEDITDPEMTRELENQMEKIAKGQREKEEVVENSRESLSEVFDSLEGKEEKVGEIVLEGLKEDRTLGECSKCGGKLVIRKSKNGFFVGCDSFPDCKNTYPLPDSKPILVEDKCDKHSLRKIKTRNFFYGCPVCMEENAGDREVLGECPECGDNKGGNLMVKRTKKGGRLAGCSRYPDCTYSLPLPRSGDLETDGICDKHGLKNIVINGDWDLGCPICNYENYKNKQ